MHNTQYDIIIAGGGLSGLSLAYYLAESEYKGKVLIVDQNLTPNNDKTWCFWTKEDPPFADIIYKTWDNLYTHSLNHSHVHSLHPYRYYCLRSVDYAQHVLVKLEEDDRFTLVESAISRMEKKHNKAQLFAKEGRRYEADIIFQSAFPPKGLDREEIKYPLIQHFLGWEVKCTEPVFDTNTATFMDFDASWNKGVAFMYVLPWNDQEALLEYTVFSHELESAQVYEDKIRGYLEHKLNISGDAFEITRKEQGQIPMEDRPYLPWYEENSIMNLGGAAGLTKPSTGYTFMRVQKHAKALAESIVKGEELVLPPQSHVRFTQYDLLLLHILSTSTEDSLRIFRDLFKNNSIQSVFQFLDEETDFAQELKIMSSVPSTPFMGAIWENGLSIW